MLSEERLVLQHNGKSNNILHKQTGLVSFGINYQEQISRQKNVDTNCLKYISKSCECRKISCYKQTHKPGLHTLHICFLPAVQMFLHNLSSLGEHSKHHDSLTCVSSSTIVNMSLILQDKQRKKDKAL